MPEFKFTSTYDHPRTDVFDWHERPWAFWRLNPDFENLKVLKLTGGIETEGARNTFRLKIGPLPRKMVAEHHGYVKHEAFNDTMVKGPFAKWNHVRAFEDEGEGTRLTENIDWRLPLHFLSGIPGGFIVRDRTRRIFHHRVRRLRADLARHAEFAHLPRKRVLVTGSTGAIGTQLCAFLSTGGHEVVRLVRPSSELPADVGSTVTWDPRTGDIVEGTLEGGFDAVINLAGAPLAGKRWSKAQKAKIIGSRSGVAARLLHALKDADSLPEVFLQASAIGAYGDRKLDDTPLDESSDWTEDFLSNVAQLWEASSDVADELGVRRIVFRTGIVLNAAAGALPQYLPAFMVGGGGPVGSGKQVRSWISFDDEIYAIHHLMMTTEAEGIYNLTAPEPVTEKVFAKTLGRVLRRPSLIPAPGLAVRILFGEMGVFLGLHGQKVLPSRLQELGYRFEHTDLAQALMDTLGRWPKDQSHSLLGIQ